jgi:hypothetical protein
MVWRKGWLPLRAREVVVRSGEHLGWWVESISDGGRTTRLLWLPTLSAGKALARWLSGKPEQEPSGGEAEGV